MVRRILVRVRPEPGRETLPARVRGRRSILRSAIPGEELHDVFHAEAAIASLADAVEGQLAPIPESLHGVHVKVEHRSDLCRREHGTEFVDGH
jgi:hypothetical protein